MPAIVGAVQVVQIASGAVFNIGDIYMVRPRSASKTYSGAGSFNTGDNIRTENQYNNTQVLDNDVNDENQLLNI